MRNDKKETRLNRLREESMQKKEKITYLPRPVDAVTSTALPNQFSKHLYFVRFFLFYFFLYLSLPPPSDLLPLPIRSIQASVDTLTPNTYHT